MMNAGDRGLTCLDVSLSSITNLSTCDGSRAPRCACLSFCPRARRQSHPQCNLRGWTVSRWTQVSPPQIHRSGGQAPCEASAMLPPSCTSVPAPGQEPSQGSDRQVAWWGYRRASAPVPMMGDILLGPSCVDEPQEGDQQLDSAPSHSVTPPETGKADLNRLVSSRFPAE